MNGDHIHENRTDRDRMNERHLNVSHIDGNALAGPLGEIFAVDPTAAVGQCASCGHTAPVATLRVYGVASALVARCAVCQEVVLRLVRGPQSAWLDLRGVSRLRIDLPGVA